jgi:hypothetical protein
MAMKKLFVFLFCACMATIQLCAQSIQKGNLLYQNAMATPDDTKDWIMEGPGKVEYKNNMMHMYSPNEEGHHVYWCPVNFPANFIAEWEAQNIETDAGLCIIFFSALGIKGEDIFDTTLPKRVDGTFTDYTKGAINCYHISYYANGKDHPGREKSHIRKNKGFYLVQDGEKGIPLTSQLVHKVKLIKNGGSIVMFIDDRKIIDWVDDDITYGKVLQDGKMGFRQMQWTHFAYKNFKVWDIPTNK